MLPPVVNISKEVTRVIAFLLPGDHPKNLRATSFSFRPYQGDKQGQVVLRSHFFKSLSGDDLEMIQDLECELYAHNDDKLYCVLEAQTIPVGTGLDFLPHVAWIDGAEVHRRA